MPNAVIRKTDFFSLLLLIVKIQNWNNNTILQLKICIFFLEEFKNSSCELKLIHSSLLNFIAIYVNCFNQWFFFFFFQSTCETPAPSPKHLSSYSITSILGEDKPNHENEPGFLRNLLKPYDRQNNYKYAPTVQTYSRPTRAEPTTSPPSYVNSASSPSIHQPIYGMPYAVPPAAYRTPPAFCWMHYSPTMHYPPPLPVYTQPPQPHRPPTASPPAHRYKDYREGTLSPPSGTFMPIRRSNSHRSSPVHYVNRGARQQESSSASDLYNELRDTLRVSDMPLNLSKHAS